MMTTTTSLLLLFMLLLVDNAESARKLPKRPAKPLKTFPRNNAAAAVAAAAAAPLAPPQAAEGTGTASGSGSELPKPLTPHAASEQPAEAGLAEPAATPVNGESKSDDLAPPATALPPSATVASSSLGQIDEDCEPDMIGFELITG
ncbi:hypothetical protein ACLKA6_014651 [Drosophila palustris]